ncbi:phenol 2-monooxygenase [Carbonactinospora thermoautotrophica]|uniref:hypothetical protein n=1 Tax=Carbonactinospora thermoautotrophica TaxID=1469144 RepID=UPI00226EACDA|nr:hypothetical protein [Carbonactinospora thermoautotrophica]MCX9191532.1 phenol 2-monooxygenase [Carbonactinospora thermoautotrophica]
MQYELRTQVIEPLRATFDSLVERYGGRPASRYEEGTIDVQPRENFHYRPLWDPAHELYDEDFSALKLADPYSFTDPRQFYYASYVTARAQMFDAFGRTLDYIEERDLFQRMPAAWRTLTTAAVLPMRHYEGGAQLVSVAGARFAYGATIEQCLSLAAFDRIGNAQLLSRVGLALGGPESLGEAKRAWLEAEDLQPLRRYAEELLVEQDWAVAAFALDLADRLIYPLLYRHLDEQALAGGAGAVSLVAQHLAGWFADQRRWVDALLAAWVADPEHGEANAAVLSDAARTWLPRACDAVRGLGRAADAAVDTGAERAVDEFAARLREQLAAAGIRTTEEDSA